MGKRGFGGGRRRRDQGGGLKRRKGPYGGARVEERLGERTGGEASPVEDPEEESGRRSRVRMSSGTLPSSDSTPILNFM